MISKVYLISKKDFQINKFLNDLSQTKIKDKNIFFYKINFNNPIEISDVIATYIDKTYFKNLSLWLSLDKNIYIKISPLNANIVIKYLFERYPY